MPDQDDPVLVQMRAQMLGQLDAILRHALQCHGRRQRVSGGAIRAAGASLVPLHDGEVLFPGAPTRRHWPAGASGPAVDEQEDRVIPILAADLNPLLDSADVDEPSLLHALW